MPRSMNWREVTKMKSQPEMAIRLGIGARRPVIALRGCRQFRDLEGEDLAERAILWACGEDDVAGALRSLEEDAFREFQQRGVETLADRDSWERAGHFYAAFYREMGGGDR